MKFSPNREAEFAEIERRADAVKKLRALPNADDVVAISLVAGRVIVVVNERTNPGHCPACGTPTGDRVEVDIDDRDVREALAQIFDDRARSLSAIAIGKYEIDAVVEVESAPVDPFPADIRTLYGGAIISARRDADRPPDVWVVTYSTNTGNGLGEVVGTEDWLRKNVPADAYDVPF